MWYRVDFLQIHKLKGDEIAKTIDATERDIEMHQCLTEALGLTDLDVVKCEHQEADNLIILYCVPRWGVDVCPDCGCLVTNIHDYPRQRTITAIAISEPHPAVESLCEK